MKSIFAVLAVIISGSAFLHLFLSFCFTYNRTPSLPIGFYLKIGKADISRGDTVIFCPPYNSATKYAEEYNFWQGLEYRCGNTPLYMKKVLGVTGDIVHVTYGGIYVNGNIVQNSKPNQKLLKSDIFKNYENKIILGHDEYFLLSDYTPHSFDSRYFGIVNKIQIKSKVIPILTFE